MAIELLGPPAFGSVGGLIQKMRENVSQGSLSEHHDYGILRLKERRAPAIATLTGESDAIEFKSHGKSV